MLIKLIPKPKIPIISLLHGFSSLSLDGITKIRRNLKATNDLEAAIEGNGNFYVNKMDGLCELMNSSNSFSIFRPRRMGKTTMIMDLKFLYKNGNFFYS